MAVTPPFTLFQNKTFYISKAVPKRASLVEKVKVNGGRTATRWSANYVVCNPCHPNPPANSISYEFIVEAAASGKLPDIDKHAATAVPPGPPPPSKRRKLHQTASTRLQQGSNNEGARLGPDSGADPDECIIVSDERPRRNPKARHIKVELGEEAEGEASEEGAGFRRNKALLKQIGEVEEVWKNYKGNLDLIVKKVTQQVVKGSEQMTLVTESVATAHTVLGKANEKLMESGLEIAEQQARARAQATNTPAAIDTAASPETSISSSQKKSHKWGGDGAADRGIIAAGLSQQSKYDDDEPWTDKVPSTKPQLKAKGLIDGRAVVRSGRGWFEVEKSLTPETKSQGSRYVERSSIDRRHTDKCKAYQQRSSREDRRNQCSVTRTAHLFSVSEEDRGKTHDRAMYEASLLLELLEAVLIYLQLSKTPRRWRHTQHPTSLSLSAPIHYQRNRRSLPLMRTMQRLTNRMTSPRHRPRLLATSIRKPLPNHVGGKS